MDADGNGTLSVEEVAAGFQRLGLECADPKKMVQEADHDKSGELDEMEFAMMVARLMGKDAGEEEGSIVDIRDLIGI
jgi:Ca2+-binding EF-hand superfamily protein